MPELPEVEVTRQGINPWLEGHTVTAVRIEQRQLRWPIPLAIDQLVTQRLHRITRRGKYLLFHFDAGTMLVHLGMSGRLSIHLEPALWQKHEHIEWLFSNGTRLRLYDPRRFGAVLWTDEADPLAHPLLQRLGPEPFSPAFCADYLWQQAQKRTLAVKLLLMLNAVVVGIGNIYANEALFATRIHPLRPACSLSLAECADLVEHSRRILHAAIAQGGTTLQDFLGATGQRGYFTQALCVYGREGLDCPRCQGQPIQRIVLGQRATYYCPQCQV